MVHIQKETGSRKYRDYSGDTLQRVLQLHKQEKLKDYTKSIGGQSAMSIEEENYLVRPISISADWGYPCESNDIIVKSYLDRSGKKLPQFRDNRPGETRLQKFLKRHKEELTKRLSQSIKESRAKVCPDSINTYFDHLSEKNVPPNAIVNYDETNFTDDPGRVKVIVRRTSKRAEKVMDTSKTATSVMFACAASGFMLPVYIVYKADHLWSTWAEFEPTGARYNRSCSGWFDTNIFEYWFNNMVLPYFRFLPPGAKVLIGDNLAGHISANVENNEEL